MLIAFPVGAFAVLRYLLPLVETPENASYLATVCGIGLTAFCAIYIWLNKDDPGLEFTLSIEQEPLPIGPVLVTMDCSVRNTGFWPVYPVAEKAAFEIVSLKHEYADGFLPGDADLPSVDCVRHQTGRRWTSS